MSSYDKNSAIANFMEYLKIPSVQPNVKYELKSESGGRYFPELLIFKTHDWDGWGINVNGKYLTHLRFADDIMLMVRIPRYMQKMLHSLDAASRHDGIGMNLDKTKAMFSNHIIPEPIKVNGEVLEVVQDYVYHKQVLQFDECVNFLKRQAVSLGLPLKIYELVPGKPIVVLTWLGKDPKLPSILLNSHMDVVPVFENSWTYPPFSAHIDKDGKIFARGSQDMKCVGIQYLEAIRRLKQLGVTLKRTLHISFVPDEEIGGHDGMKIFVHRQEFKDLNIGFALDEGLASPNEEFVVYNGERSIWQFRIHCTGQPGHGSLLLPNTAGEKLRFMIDKFMDLREQQKKILESNPKFTIGDVTTVNLTQVQGGVQSNVIPEKLTVIFDVRLDINVNHEEFEQMVQKWCSEAGEGVTYDFEQKNPKVECTKTDATNAYWIAFKSATDELNLKLDLRIFPGATDSRYVRHVGIPAIGFSPMNFTPILLHDHDEFLDAKIFLKGIEIYEKIITAVANV